MKKITSFLIVALMAFVSVAANNQNVHASEVDVLVTKLVEKGILTGLDAEVMKTEIENAEKARHIEVRNELNPWLDGLTSKGDIRVRMEGFSFDDTNRKDRMRYRVRARWGLEKKFNSEWKAGFRVATGPTDEAVSTNQTLDDEFDFKNFNLNRAYAKWNPTERFQQSWDAIKHVEIGAGKLANPYKKKWGTSIIWDGDVEPEGIYEEIDFHLADLGDKGSWDVHTLLGQWVLEEQSTKKDISMFSYGIGTTIKPDKNNWLKGMYVFYDWDNYASVLDGATEIDTIDSSNLGGTNPGGNDVEIDAFKVHSAYIEAGTKKFDTGLFGVQPLKVFGHIAHNSQEGDGVVNSGQDNAWSAGVTLGKAKKPNTWQATYQYFEIEQNSVPGNFSESDLGSGGTNKEGHKMQFKYNLTKEIQLAWTNWLVDDIIQSSSTVDPEVWRTQLDLVFKF